MFQVLMFKAVLKWKKHKQAKKILTDDQSLIVTTLFATNFWSDIIFQSEICDLNGIFNRKN